MFSLVEHAIDTGDAVSIKQRQYRATPDLGKKKLIVRYMKCLRRELFTSPFLLGALFWSKISFAKFRIFKKVT